MIDLATNLTINLETANFESFSKSLPNISD